MEGTEEMGDCTICLSPYTSTLRKQIKCPFCPLVSCLTCVKRYMLESVQDAHCMGCKRAWNRDFIDAATTIAWRRGALKTHREDMLVDREKARLPLLQPRIEARVQAEEMSATIAAENKRCHQMEIQVATMRENVLRLHRRQQRLFGVANGTVAPADLDGPGEKKEVRAFTQKCPAEDCRGFLSSQWKCGTCQVWVCPDCCVPKGRDKDSPHTCDEGQKATAQLIRKETRPCPKCGEGISKVDGCDQMWCITCKTPFSWTTGKLVFGVVHNPHYYQWLRQQNGGEAPRVAGDVPCGGLVGFYSLQRNPSIPKKYMREIENIHRITAELHDGILRQYPRLDEIPDNGDLGIEYTLKRITMEQWKKELWSRETKREKGLDLRGPLDLFVNVSSEVLRQMAAQMTPEEFMNLLGQLRTLRGYVNDEIEKIGKRYSCMVPKITNCWHWDPHGGNRKEIAESRNIREHVLVLKQDLVDSLPQDRKDALTKMLSNSIEMPNDADGNRRAALEHIYFDGNTKDNQKILKMFDYDTQIWLAHHAREDAARAAAARSTEATSVGSVGSSV